ncbi:unnamed protein product [Dovyalis caffra]|uniref:LAGLIDADG homing endonuclease n=1 Tax=Dovyalis caffra TaxID=77055 RepID=A0AAV1QL12_9ROSI|nr:unnamed protein product [Dovyalis caffra]
MLDRESQGERNFSNGGLKLESTSHQREEKKKTKNEAGSSLPSGSIYGLWILGMVSNAPEAKRLRGEGLLIKGRLRGSFKKRSQKEQKEVYERLSLLLSTHIGLSPAAPGSALGYCLLGTFSTYGSQRHPHSIIDRNNQAR